MTARFEGQVAIVTGAGSGIGRAVAERFAEEGGRVVLVGRDPAKLERVASGLPSEATLVVPGDHARVANVRRIVATAIESFGRVDLLVNNAGTFHTTTVADTSDVEWSAALANNLTGPFLMSREVIPHMRAQGHGVVIHDASTLGLRPIAGTAPYAVAKAGLVMLGRAMAVEEAAHGIRVLVVCPGVVDTPIHAQRPEVADVGAFLGEIGAQHPLGRVGRAAEVAATILFLASGESAWTTGAVVTVDGGISLV